MDLLCLGQLALLAVAVAACSEVQVVDGSGSGSGSGANGSGGAASQGASGTGGPPCSGCAFAGFCNEPLLPCSCPCSEGERITFDGREYRCEGGCYVLAPDFPNNCAMTEFNVVDGMASGLSLPSSCPDSWGAMFFAGPTVTVSQSGGFVSPIWVVACDSTGRGIELDTMGMMPIPYPLVGGHFEDGAVAYWDLDGGDLVLTEEGAVGEIVAGQWSASFSGVNGTLQLSGSFRACHVPTPPAP